LDGAPLWKNAERPENCDERELFKESRTEGFMISVKGDKNESPLVLVELSSIAKQYTEFAARPRSSTSGAVPSRTLPTDAAKDPR
jgi:hypothetical protein